MTTRQQRPRSERDKSGSPNGTGPANTLSPEQVEDLRQMLQPLVMQWQLCQAAVVGYMTAVHILNAKFSIDIATGVVTLVPPPVPAQALGPGD